MKRTFLLLTILACLFVMSYAMADTLTLPAELTVIEEEAFFGASSLDTVIVPEGVVEIGSRAFADSSVTAVHLPESLTTIADDAFNNCSDFSIYCPEYSLAHQYAEKKGYKFSLSVLPNDTDIPQGLRYEVYDTYAIITGYSGEDDMLVLPDEISGVPVTAIMDHAFEACSFSRITLPKSLKKIGAYAFQDCINLSGVFLPNSIETMGTCAFSYCESIKEINHPLNWKYTELSESDMRGPFAYMDNLTKIIIPNGVQEIPKYAYWGCYSLTELDLPDTLKVIGSYAFYACHSLTAVSLPDSIETMGPFAFGLCGSLSTINHPLNWTNVFTDESEETQLNSGGPFAFSGRDLAVFIPEGVTTIPRYAYRYSEISNITFPQSVKVIEDHAFFNCAKLNSVTLNEGLIEIKSEAFSACNELRSITLPDSLEYINGCAFSNTPLSSINHPIQLKGKSDYTIGNSAFFSCNSLKTLIIPEGVTCVAPDVFCDIPSLETILFPDSLIEISSSAFWHCTGLNSIRLPSNLQTLNISAFHGCYISSIYIPKSTTEIWVNGLVDDASFDGLTIYGEPGSYAETYALKNGIPFSTDPFPGTEQEEKFIHLSGSVTLADGTPLENIFVHVYDTCIENDVGIAYTDRNGNWSCSVSSNIAYIIRYDHPSYTITATEKTITPTKDTVLDTAIAVLAAGDGTITPTFVMQVNNASISDTGVMVGDIVTFTLSAEGAQKVRLIADGKAYNEYSLINGAAVIERSFSRSGTRQISFQAYDGTAWGSACAAQTLIVNADGMLATPVINAIETQYIGESFTVSWEQVEHAENYTVYLYHDDLLWPALSNTEKSTTSGLSMVIPGNLLYTDGEYLIEIIASGYRYNQASSSITFMVEKTSEGASITYPESGMSYSVGDTIHTRYTTGNGTKGVRLLVTAPNTPKKLYSPDESGVFYPVAEQVGNYTLTPYYSRNEEDFTETTADGCGNSITVIVNPPAISSLLQGNNKQYSIRYSGTAPVFNGSVSNERYTVKVYLNDTFVEEIIPAKGQFSYTAASIENVGKYVYSFVPCYNNLTGKAVEFPVYIIKQISSAVKYTPEPVNLFTKPDATANHLLPYGSAVTILGEYGSEYWYVTTGDLSGFLPANSNLVDTLVPETIDIVVTDSNDLPYTAVGECRLYQINADGAETVNAIVTTHSSQKLTYEAIKTDDTFTVEIPTTEATAYCVTFDATGTNGKTFYSTECFPYIGVDTNSHWANHECWSNHKKMVPTYAVPNNPYWIAEQVDVSERRLICFGKTIDDLLCVAVAKQNGTLEKYMLIDQNELQLSKNITTYRALCIINPYNKDKYSGDPCEKNFHNIKKLLNNIDGITFEPPVLGGTSSDIFDALSTLNEKEDYNDVTYLYWSSHGSSWGTWEILPVLSTGKYDQFNFADLIMSQIYDVDGSDELKYAWEGKLNIIIDSCYSGLFVDYVLENEEYDIPRESVTALMSAQADENSIIDIWIGGYFTAELARQTTENTSLGELTNSIKISKTINGVTHTPHPVVWPAESSSHIFFTEDPDAVK